MSEDVYNRLREFLDKLPGGYPASDTGVEIRILKKLFTPEDAELAVQLNPLPEPLPAIAERLGKDEKELAGKLDSMGERGLILRAPLGDQVIYAALQFAVGIYEFQLKTLDRELAEMMEEYFPYFAKRWTSTRTLQLRIIPVHSALGSSPSVSSYDQIREMARTADPIVVCECICTKEKGLIGEPCDRPKERCLQFNMAAQFSIDSGNGRKITQEELNKILDMGEEQSLVLSPNNAQDLMVACLCCDCCCGWLRMLKETGRPADHVQSTYQASIDPDLCSVCGTCADRCQVEAIQEGDDYYSVKQTHCIGCGLCVSECPDEAISLVEMSDVDPLPANIIETNLKILKEQGTM